MIYAQSRTALVHITAICGDIINKCGTPVVLFYDMNDGSVNDLGVNMVGHDKVYEIDSLWSQFTGYTFRRVNTC